MRNPGSNHPNRFAFPGILAFCSVLAACAPRGSVAPPPSAVPSGPTTAVRGVAVSTGLSVPIEGATVSVGERRAVIGNGGTFSVAGVSPGKQSVVIEKRFSTGPIRRVLGISTIFVADNPVEIRVAVRDATDVDAFCLECHPPLAKVTRRDQKFRDAHPSGMTARIAASDKSLLDDRGRVTCESCHTPHIAGNFPFFGLGEIRKGPFCNRCHRSGGGK
ncbi:MAG: hypothetical protein OHK0028_13470 [Deltaproteobacteria bacterium]